MRIDKTVTTELFNPEDNDDLGPDVVTTETYYDDGTGRRTIENYLEESLTEITFKIVDGKEIRHSVNKDEPSYDCRFPNGFRRQSFHKLGEPYREKGPSIIVRNSDDSVTEEYVRGSTYYNPESSAHKLTRDKAGNVIRALCFIDCKP